MIIPRVEEYVSRGLDGNIVDPDESLVYTKRKLHLLSSTREITSTTDTSDSELPTSSSVLGEPKPKFPSSGWSVSLDKAPFFSRVEIDRHISQSGKSVGGSQHHTLPTGLTKAKTYLQDEYLHDIETAYDQSFFFYRAKCFHSFKKSGSPHELKLALCVVSGEVKYAYCGPTFAAGKSGFCNHVLALMLKVCKFSFYNCQKVTDLKDEDDENPASASTSRLQTWHQPRIEGISPQPVTELTVIKTQQEERISTGVQCKLYEARKQQQSDVKHFLQTIKEIDETFGLLQTCEVVDTVVLNMCKPNLAIVLLALLAHIRSPILILFLRINIDQEIWRAHRFLITLHSHWMI